MAVRYLEPGQLRSLSKAAIELGLHERRDVLLASIDRQFTSRLKNASNPGDQLRLDLEELNRTEKLPDGTVPLRTWLEDAIDAAAGRNRAEALEHALALLNANLPGPQRWTWTPPPDLPERKERVIHTDDRVPFDFLERGRMAGASVALVSVRRYDHQQPSRKPPVEGTGWMIGPRLMITAHHVVNARGDGEADASDPDLHKQASSATATFDYDGEGHEGRRIEVDALEACDPQLDFALLRLKTDPEVPPLELAEHPPRIDERHHPPLNIIQHPQGRPKQVALRNNLATTAKGRPTDLGYFSDTEIGSSGAPVFDDNWRVVAIHRAYAPLAKVENFQGHQTAVANVGTRMDKIREYLQAKHGELWRTISDAHHRPARPESRSDAKVTPLRAVRHPRGAAADDAADPSQLRDLIATLAGTVELVGSSYSTGGRPRPWAEAELFQQLEQLRRFLDDHARWLRHVGLDRDLSTLDLRDLLRHYPTLADGLLDTLRELGREPASIALLDRYDQSWRSLEELLSGIQQELELSGPGRPLSPPS
jgi:endonuclease G